MTSVNLNKHCGSCIRSVPLVHSVHSVHSARKTPVLSSVACINSPLNLDAYCKHIFMLMHYSVPKLKKLAKSYGIKGYSTMNKNELLQILATYMNLKIKLKRQHSKKII